MMEGHLYIAGKGIIANLHFVNMALISFAFNFYSQFLDVEFYKNENALVLNVITKTKGGVKATSYITKFDSDFMQGFNNKVLYQYANHIFKHGIDEQVMKTFLEDFISYIDRVTGYRFNDIFTEVKKLLKDKQIEAYYFSPGLQRITLF